MTKIISIILTCFILVQSVNIDFVDIIKFDEFIEHAQFHEEKYNDNFFVFISKHYGELKQEHNQEHEEEQPKHKKLPFEHQLCSQHLPIAFVLMVSYKLILKPEVIIDAASNFSYKEINSLFEKQKIFHPPKQA